MVNRLLDDEARGTGWTDPRVRIDLGAPGGVELAVYIRRDEGIKLLAIGHGSSV